MPNLLSSLNTGRAINAELEQLLEAAVARLQAGENVDLNELAVAHPEHAEEIRQLLPAIEMLVGMGAAGADVTAEIGSHLHAADATTTTAPTPLRQLGDFRIIRELGRGGMGTVFEAEQLSMGRRVALKVLPFAALAHEKSLQRFRNEVRAAASLDHPHIVAVYSVGEERGVHFYAMQLIRGQSLAEVILQQRRVHDPLPPAGRGVPAPGSPAASGNEDPTIDSAISPPSTAPIEQARVSTARDSKYAAERFRTAARLGIQAAEALQHAHDQGVLHRDIKPGNLLLDADGKLYVTDFGLARIQSDAGMTMTGDIVGTLRYMAPEQALAKRVVIDHRADVYSLGATLYELLTLQPAFGETDRSELLKQIAFEDPKPLRKLDRRIPAELETIILKAMEKSPHARYQSAQALVHDLRAFLDNLPISAKPSTWRDRVLKWSRRHPAGVRASLFALLVTSIVCAATIGWVMRDRHARGAAAEAIASAAIEEANELIQQEKWPEALAAARRAEDVLKGSHAIGALHTRARTVCRDVEMVILLEDISSSPFIDGSGDAKYDPEFDRRFAEAFREYGIDVEVLSSRQAAQRVKQSDISVELVKAIDTWAWWQCSNDGNGGDWTRLNAIATEADPDPWRNRWRDVLNLDGDAQESALTELASSTTTADWQPQNMRRLAVVFRASGNLVRAIDVLQASHRRHPQSYETNIELGNSFLNSDRPDDAILHFSIAAALRPESIRARLGIGLALRKKLRLNDAIAVFREGLELNPNDYSTLTALGRALEVEQRLDEAISVLEKAIRLEPRHAAAHNVLGDVFQKKGLLDEAISKYREAIRLESDYGDAHASLGRALKAQGHTKEAVDHLKSAIELTTNARALAVFNYELGEALLGTGAFDEARTLYVTSLRSADLSEDLRHETLVSICRIAEALRGIGRTTEADALLDEAIQLQLSQVGLNHPDTRGLYEAAGRLDEAIAAGREALNRVAATLGPNDPATLMERQNLAATFMAARRHEDAEQECRNILAASKDSLQILRMRYWLASCLLHQGDSNEGVRILRDLYYENLPNYSTPDAIELGRAWAGLSKVSDSVEGVPDQDGLDFDGDCDFVILPGLFFDGRPPWTLEAIVRPLARKETFTHWVSLVSSAQGGSIGLDSALGKWSVGMYAAAVNSDAWLQNYVSAPASQPIAIHEWQHVAGVWDGKELRLFVDGKLQQPAAKVAYCSQLSLQPFFLGADPDGGTGIAQGFFNGRMRAARISRGVEYSEDFSPPDHLAKSLRTIALYDFTSDTGRYAIDRSGKGHHGIIVGARFAEVGE
jgi:serine/threonine protein kinase/cytochrome c-type biogenesis protein CcmH/NrfG